MAGQEFPGNSHRKRETPASNEKKIEVAIVGKATVRKKSLGKRMKEMFVGGDTDSVMNYLVADVIIPQIKDLLTEAVTQGIERLIHGDGRPAGRRGSRSSGPTNYTNYSNRYSRPSSSPLSRPSDRPPTVRSHRIEDIILETRLDAQRVLDGLMEVAEKYDVVTVADLYGSVEWSATHTDGKWGWNEEDLEKAHVRRIREGYLLDLPQPEYID